METLGDRIRAARSAAGKTQREVAEALRIERVNVTQWESNTTGPEKSRLPDLAALLSVSVEWLLTGKGAGPQNRPQIVRQKPIQRTELVGDADFPVYAAARGGGEGHLIVTFEAIEYVKRPSVLLGVPRGYGLLVVGDSMEPMFWPGDTLLVHPHLPPLANKGAVFYDTLETGEAEAMVKLFLRENHGEWRLRQYNPQRDFAVKKADWPIVHRIVGKYDGR